MKCVALKAIVDHFNVVGQAGKDESRDDKNHDQKAKFWN